PASRLRVRGRAGRRSPSSLDDGQEAAPRAFPGRTDRPRRAGSWPRGETNTVTGGHQQREPASEASSVFVERELRRGLELTRGGEHFAAHEAFEAAWRAAEPLDRDFFQGHVHVVVAWYQAARGNRK